MGKWHLQQKQERLKREVALNLGFLIGSVTSQGIRVGYSLTTKENSKTRTKYIRKAMVNEVLKMTARHADLKALLKELAEVNWELLKLENEL